MSAKSEKTSTEGLDRPERDSVNDFLYNDARRIASFLSQFDKDGHLTALVRTQGITESTGSNYGGTGGRFTD
jgi:phage gp16-like protein